MVVQVEPEGTGQEKRRLRMFRETAEAWPGLGLYERFEQAVALVLTFLVSCVIVVAIAHLVLAVGLNLFFNRLAPLDHSVFQAIFGMITTVLIALEFNHTILSILHRKDSIIQLDRNPHCIARRGAEIHHH
jgi:Phosphate-starvation-inducible E family